MPKNYKRIIGLAVTETVASAIARAALAHHTLEADMIIGGIKSLVGLSGDVFEQREAKRLFEKMADEACKQLMPTFEEQHDDISEDGSAAVAQLLADTIGNDAVSAEVLVSHRVDADKLADALFDSASDKLQQFSDAEVRLFQRALREACLSIVKISVTLPAFTPAAFTSIINSEAKIMEDVRAVLSQIEKERQETVDRQLTAMQRFEMQYREALNQFDRIELFGLRASAQSRRYNLSVAYVTLTVEPRRRNPRHANRDANLVAMTLKGVSAFDLVAGGDKLSEQSRRSIRSRMTVDELLATRNRVFVRGLAGSGKTTLLQWIAVRASRGDFPSSLNKLNGSIAFFIRLRSHVQLQHPYPRLALPEPEQFLGELQPYVLVPMPSGWVDQKLASGNAFILIDGVDEVDEIDQERLRGWITMLCNRYPNCRFIVTGRTHLKENWLDSAGFHSAEIQPMLRADIESFIDHWHAAVACEVIDPEERSELPKLAENLKATLRRNSEIRRLATSPLLCSMLCALHRDGQKHLPTDRVKLYRECVDVLLVKRESQAGIKLLSLPELTLNQKLTILQHVAYELLSLGVAETSKTSVEDWIGRKLASIPGIPMDADAESILEALVQRSGVIREPSAGAIDFVHKTFQEFLAASALLDDADWQRVVRNAVDERWTEAIVLAVGMAPKPIRDLLMERFVREAELAVTVEFRKIFALLAAACLSLATEVDADLRSKILTLLDGAVPPTSRTEAKMLARVGQPAVELLSRPAPREEGDIIMCIHALANEGSEHALNALEKYADTRNPRVRAEILRSWDYFDRAEFAEKVLSVAFGKNGRHPVPLVGPLDGIGAATGVTHLNFTPPDLRTKPIDLSGIAEVIELQSLVVDYSQGAFDLGTFAPLTELQELTFINVGQFLNFSALSDKKKMRVLRLSRCRGMGSLEWVTGLNDLTHLSLEASFDCKSLQPLALLSNLRFLEIRNFKELRDINPLSQAVHLEQISLAGCRVVADVSPLALLPHLKQVNLRSCSRLLDIRPLQKRKEIEILIDSEVLY